MSRRIEDILEVLEGEQPPLEDPELEDPLLEHRAWLEANPYLGPQRTGPRLTDADLMSAITPATSLLSFLGGPVGMAASIADVEASAIQEGRNPEWYERAGAGLGFLPFIRGTINPLNKLRRWNIDDKLGVGTESWLGGTVTKEEESDILLRLAKFLSRFPLRRRSPVDDAIDITYPSIAEKGTRMLDLSYPTPGIPDDLSRTLEGVYPGALRNSQN